jgi:hypothetical protein
MGVLCERGLLEISKWLGSSPGAAGDAGVPQRVSNYFIGVFHARRPIDRMDPDVCHDTKHTALCLDALGVGNLPQARRNLPTASSWSTALQWA